MESIHLWRLEEFTPRPLTRTRYWEAPKIILEPQTHLSQCLCSWTEASRLAESDNGPGSNVGRRRSSHNRRFLVSKWAALHTGWGPLSIRLPQTQVPRRWDLRLRPQCVVPLQGVETAAGVEGTLQEARTALPGYPENTPSQPPLGSRPDHTLQGQFKVRPSYPPQTMCNLKHHKYL